MVKMEGGFHVPERRGPGGRAFVSLTAASHVLRMAPGTWEVLSKPLMTKLVIFTALLPIRATLDLPALIFPPPGKGPPAVVRSRSPALCSH